MKRPRSVLVVSILQIITGALGVVSGILSFVSNDIFQIVDRVFKSSRLATLPTEVLISFGLFNSIMAVVCAIFLLQGKNWARIVTLVLLSVGLAQNLIFYGFSIIIIPGALFSGVIFYFLMCKTNLAYFKS